MGQRAASLKAIVATMVDSASAHPSVEDLLRYHEGDLPTEEHEELLDHVAVCSECTRALLDASRFPNLTADELGSDLSPGDVDQRWERLRVRLAREGSLEGGSLGASSRELESGSLHTVIRGRFAWWSNPRMLRLVAVLLLATTLSMMLVSALLWRDRAQPRLRVSVATLSPDVERSGLRPETLALGSDSEGAMLLLAFFDEHPVGRFEVAMWRGTEAAVGVFWQRRGLRRNRDGYFSLLFPRGFLTDGIYRLEIHKEGTTHEPLATYFLRVESELARTGT